MGAISKTAKASMVKEVKRSEVETPEQSIKKLRNDLAASLYIPSYRIKALLDRYDEAVSKIVAQEFELGSIGLRLEEAVAVRSMEAFIESGKSYRVSRVHDELSIEELKPTDIYEAFASEMSEQTGVKVERATMKPAVLGAAYDSSQPSIEPSEGYARLAHTYTPTGEEL